MSYLDTDHFNLDLLSLCMGMVLRSLPVTTDWSHILTYLRLACPAYYNTVSFYTMLRTVMRHVCQYDYTSKLDNFVSAAHAIHMGRRQLLPTHIDDYGHVDFMHDFDVLDQRRYQSVVDQAAWPLVPYAAEDDVDECLPLLQDLVSKLNANVVRDKEGDMGYIILLRDHMRSNMQNWIFERLTTTSVNYKDTVSLYLDAIMRDDDLESYCNGAADDYRMNMGFVMKYGAFSIWRYIRPLVEAEPWEGDIHLCYNKVAMDWLVGLKRDIVYNKHELKLILLTPYDADTVYLQHLFTGITELHLCYSWFAYADKAMLTIIKWYQRSVTYTVEYGLHCLLDTYKAEDGDFGSLWEEFVLLHDRAELQTALEAYGGVPFPLNIHVYQTLHHLRAGTVSRFPMWRRCDIVKVSTIHRVFIADGDSDDNDDNERIVKLVKPYQAFRATMPGIIIDCDLSDNADAKWYKNQLRM